MWQTLIEIAVVYGAGLPSALLICALLNVPHKYVSRIVWFWPVTLTLLLALMALLWLAEVIFDGHP